MSNELLASGVRHATAFFHFVESNVLPSFDDSRTVLYVTANIALVTIPLAISSKIRHDEAINTPERPLVTWIATHITPTEWLKLAATAATCTLLATTPVLARVGCLGIIVILADVALRGQLPFYGKL